jgi:hypothetical protein
MLGRILNCAIVLALVCLPLLSRAQDAAKDSTVEYKRIQMVKTVSATVEDQVGRPLSKVTVQEFNCDWTAVLRSSETDKVGKFELPSVEGRKLYCFQFSKTGFDSLRVHMQVDLRHGKDVHLTLRDAIPPE